MNILQEKYPVYYTPRGSYRKLLLKKEAVSIPAMYDLLSNLAVRLDRLLVLPESVQYAKVCTDIKEVKKDMDETAKIARTIGSRDFFCEAYEALGSIVEGIEDKVSTILNGIPELSEDAKLIQRQTHHQKNAPVDSTRSRAAKNAWKQNKDRYTKAIRKFHKSTAGKTFHRNLTRFNRRKGGSVSESDVLDLSKGLSSMLTHLLAEVQQYDLYKAESKVVLTEDVSVLREVFQIFNSLLLSAADGYFVHDSEAVGDVLEVVEDFYSMAE
jgi:hypothetical protein